MWKTAKAWLVFWWAVWCAGPQTHIATSCITPAVLEAAVEKACRRILTAHAARLTEARDPTPVLIQFMDENEAECLGQQTLPSWQRSLVVEFDGQSFRASRFDDAKKAWIYRLVR